MVFEFQRAQRMRHTLDRIRQRMRKIVRWVDTPGITCAVMMHAADAVQYRVAHIDVAAGHIDLGAKCAAAIGKLAGAHATKQIEIFVYAAIAEGARASRLCERAAVGAYLFAA